MSQNQRDHEVGRGKPPMHSRFKMGRSGNPRGPRPKNPRALLVEALDEPVVVTIDGERREITKRRCASSRRSYPAPGGRTTARKIGCAWPLFVIPAKERVKKSSVAWIRAAEFSLAPLAGSGVG